MSCSHVLVKVASLDHAVADFRKLGFEVQCTSRRRAHVRFTRGPIIELLTTPAWARLSEMALNLIWGKGAGTRMAGWARADEGFCDVAVRTEAPERAGVPIGKVFRCERDGIRFAYPCNPALPFLVTRYDSPRHLPRISHPNGAIALVRVEMDVAPCDLPAFDWIAGGDRDFAVSKANTTRVRAIRLAGLTFPLEPELLHGITVLPETGEF